MEICVTLMSGQAAWVRAQPESRMDQIKRDAQKALKVGLYALLGRGQTSDFPV